VIIGLSADASIYAGIPEVRKFLALDAGLQI